jgi:hypothetical protein
MFLRIYQHLLPNARAWRLTTEKQLRQFFEGLTDLPLDIRDFFDLVWLDIFPDTTRELDAWDTQFALPNTFMSEQERRDRLDAVWKALGGQSPRYIQDTLQEAGFDVFIHEWWELPITEPPVVRNPFTFLNDGRGIIKYIMGDGTLEANDGNLEANDGASIDPTGFVLVNKFFVRDQIGDGAEAMNDGNPEAQDGGAFNIYRLKTYIIPTDTTKWPYFLYISGQIFPDHAIVSASRRNEFETLCLKICPTQQWLGMLIDYA